MSTVAAVLREVCRLIFSGNDNAMRLQQNSKSSEPPRYSIVVGNESAPPAYVSCRV